MSADNVQYFRDWAADIRKASGSSVDADRIDSAAAEIENLRERVAALTDENNILGDIIRRQEARLSPVTDATAIISADQTAFEADLAEFEASRGIKFRDVPNDESKNDGA